MTYQEELRLRKFKLNTPRATTRPTPSNVPRTTIRRATRRSRHDRANHLRWPEGRRGSQRGHPVQGVLGVGRRAALRVSESRAVGRRVVGVRVREVSAGQEVVARRRTEYIPTRPIKSDVLPQG